MSLLGLQVLADAELEGQGSRSRQPGRRPDRTTDTNQGLEAKRINQQLDEILAVQEAILKRYDELMEELRIVKVRASQ